MRGYYCLLWIGLILDFALGTTRSLGEPVAHWLDDTLVLDNGAVLRKIVYDGKRHAFRTAELKLPGERFNFVGPASDEFYFEIDGKPCRGSNGWEVKGVEPLTAARDGRGAAVVLRMIPKGDYSPERSPLELKIIYLLYPKLPVICKKLVLKNMTDKEVKVESLDMERLRLSFQPSTAQTFANYARWPKVGKYLGDWYDSTVVVHDTVRGRGLVLGNVAPGVLKRTMTFLDGAIATVGVTHRNQEYAFRKWLRPGESWESPAAFLCPYGDCPRPEKVLEGPVADYLRRHLGLRVAELKAKPQFIFNTWYPYQDRISEVMVLEMAEAAAECGVKDFQIDAGWYRNEASPPNEPWWAALGDYAVDRKKFPHGLKPVFQRIRELGMRPGLWMSLATVSHSCRVFREHPEWLIRDRQGRPAYLHSDPSVDKNVYTACLSTGWYDYIKAAMLKQIKENDLKYIKIDLGFVTGAYRFDAENGGCFATNHPHRDREESLGMNYQRAWQLFDELHAAAPDLYIDCTFETMGKLQLIDLAMCRHAHGNWLFNCYDAPPIGCLRQRNLAWLVSPAIPPAAVILGCMRMDNPQADLMVGSLAGTVPVLMGDPRKLSAEQRARYRQWSAWLERAQQKHAYDMYRQDLAGFGEPREGCWDGWQRINTDTQSGGIVGVFRQGSRDARRTVYVERLHPDRIYAIRRGPDGKEITELTGQELEEKGFPVELDNPWDGTVFEIDATLKE
jgi:alpha-galactosidase